MRRPLRVVGPTVLVTLMALASALALPLRYRASAVVRATWESPEEARPRKPRPDEAGRRLQEVRRQALRRSTIERLLRETGPQPPGEGVPLSRDVERLFDAASIRSLEADTFAFEYVHADPERAALVSNRLASLLVEESEKEWTKRAESDPRLLEARLVKARAELDHMEAELRGAGPGDTVAPRQPDGGPAGRDQLEAEERAVAAGLSAARERADRLRQAIEAEAPAPGARTSPDLARLRAELAELRKRYTEEHPDVEALVRRIRRLEAESPPQAEPLSEAQDAALRTQLGEVEAEIEALSRKEAGLDARKRGPAPRSRSARGAGRDPRPAQDFEALARDHEQASKAFLALQDEWNAAETASRLRPGVPARFVIVQAAPVPARPCFPNRLLLTLVGVGLGLVLGLATSVLAEMRDGSIKSPEDLEGVLPQPLLATIPEVRVRARRR